MMTDFSRFRSSVLVAVACGALLPGWALGVSPEDRWITPARLGLPQGNVRTSEPVVRIYKTNENGKPLKVQPDGYPRTKTPGMTVQPGEIEQKHQGVDISTRPAGSKTSQPMNFTSGVHGVVERAGGGEWNTITIRLDDGTQIQYLHSSKVHVREGQRVTPDTVIGTSGNRGATSGEVHIHVQARDPKGNIIADPDAAFRRGVGATAAAPQPATSPAPKPVSDPPSRGAVGGVLVNPKPERESARDDTQGASQILKNRARSKDRGWRIELPGQGAEDGRKKH